MPVLSLRPSSAHARRLWNLWTASVAVYASLWDSISKNGIDASVAADSHQGHHEVLGHVVVVVDVATVVVLERLGVVAVAERDE